MNPEKFWSKVVKSDGCWLWTGTKNNCGYGQFGLNGSTVLAHRYAWQLNKGLIPKGLCICHFCDEPSCVNPEHLFIGTHADNMADCARKGRAYRGYQRGESNGRARLTWKIVEEIRLNVANGVRQIDEVARLGISKGRVSEIVNHKSW